MNEVEEKSKVGKISRLFQKKVKKKAILYSSSIVSSQHSSPQEYDTASMIQQQRKLLADLDMQKSMYSADVIKLQEQLSKTREKLQQRSREKEMLEANYQAHLRSARTSDDDIQSIACKLQTLRDTIHSLASELLPHADPILTSEKLGTLWLNLSTSIQQLGHPQLPPARIHMLTEKFMMDVLVQNLNIHFFPGLSCNTELIALQQWFEQHDTSSLFSTRLRQELSKLVVKHQLGSATWKKSVDRTWHHLYKGLQKAYPNYNNGSVYTKKLRGLVDYTMALGSAIRGHEVCITAVDVREGVQSMDRRLMDDEDGQVAGVIAFCIAPPFVVRVGKGYEPLLRGRVLCFPSIK